MKFVIGETTFDVESLKKYKTYGLVDQIPYDEKTLSFDKFMTKLVEAATEAGREEVRNSIKSALKL